MRTKRRPFMKVLCLGGAGRICREAVLDLVTFSSFEKITVADVDERAGHEVLEWLGDSRLDFKKVDIRNRAETVRVMREYDVVMDGTTISLNDLSTSCIAEAGCHGINLNGFGEEYKYDPVFKGHGKTHVPGFGMTPGITDMMVKHAADRMETVEIVRVSHGAFRPIAFSPSITETTTYEYDPDLPGRVVFENGRFIQVPPFARPREIALPEPFGTHPQYIIPHAETKTVAQYLAHKGVKLIEVRGTWPPKNMELIKALYDWGFMRNDRVKVGEAEIGILDAIAAYLRQAPEGQTTDLYGYALHVEVIGTKDGQKVQHILTHTHPRSDGSVPGWEKLRAYTRCVGIPLSIGAQILASGKVEEKGVVIPERAFDPSEVFRELEKRQILIHEKVTPLS
jgi:lysine 6-dehydrogenase